MLVCYRVGGPLMVGDRRTWGFTKSRISASLPLSLSDCHPMMCSWNSPSALPVLQPQTHFSTFTFHLVSNGGRSALISAVASLVGDKWDNWGAAKQRQWWWRKNCKYVEMWRVRPKKTKKCRRSRSSKKGKDQESASTGASAWTMAFSSAAEMKKCIKCSWAMVNFWNEALVNFFRIQIGNWFLLWLMNLVIDEMVQNKAIFVLWNKWASKVGAFTTVRNSATTWTSKRFISHNSLLKFMCTKKSTKNLSIWKGAVMLDPLLACDPRLPGILINVSCFPTLTSHTQVLTLTISQTAASIFHHGIPCLGRKYISQCLTIPPLLFPHSPTQCLKILYTQVSRVPDH